MDQHALALLSQDDTSWTRKWPVTRRIQGSDIFDRVHVMDAHQFLYYLILESQRLGGDVLNQFWSQLGSCDDRLKINVDNLKTENFVSAERSFDVLFQGLDPGNIDFGPVFEMVGEFFNLGILFMNPDGRTSGTSSADSVNLKDVRNKTTQELLDEFRELGDSGFGSRKQAVLKSLSFKRDGDICPWTGRQFQSFHCVNGIFSRLVQIVPNSVHGKESALKCIAMFAGDDVLHDILNYLNHLRNVVQMELNAHASYDMMEWGIQATEHDGEIKYIYRRIPFYPEPGPAFTILKDGDEIPFGRGPSGEQLGKGPIPRLCNLRLAIARLMRLSGAADVISAWKDKAGDDGPFIASEEYCDILDAKLYLSGRATVV